MDALLPPRWLIQPKALSFPIHLPKKLQTCMKQIINMSLMICKHLFLVLPLGTPSPSKTDEFSEKFQTAIDPPPSFFGKLYCKFFLKFMTEVSSIMAKICNINFWIENGPPPFGTFPKIHPFWKGKASLSVRLDV